LFTYSLRVFARYVPKSAQKSPKMNHCKVAQRKCRLSACHRLLWSRRFASNFALLRYCEHGLCRIYR